MKRTRAIVILPRENVVCVRVYDIPSEEVSAFASLLPKGSKELAPAIGIFSVPDLKEAEAACDTMYRENKLKTVESL